MDPEQTMMSGCDGNDLLRSRHPTRIVRFGEASQEGFKMSRMRWNVMADLDGAGTEGTGLHAKPLTRLRVLHPQQVIGQKSTELLMNPCQVLDARNRSLRVLTGINQALYMNVRDGFPLKVTFSRIA
jgi:hypothetical protein